MTRERRLPLLERLEACRIEVLPVCDCNEARRFLESCSRVQVVLCDTTLPDGNWRNVLEDVQQSSTNADVILCARLSDERLWIDALESGAYDLLIEPYTEQEVERILEAAAARSYMRSLPPARAISHKTKAAGGPA
jgi:DNA-binding NtrC family response regulator